MSQFKVAGMSKRGKKAKAAANRERRLSPSNPELIETIRQGLDPHGQRRSGLGV